jgi:hypothetical protein
VFAAVGGMAVPAVLYVVLAGGVPGGHGWGTPMATDIASSIGASSRQTPETQQWLVATQGPTEHGQLCTSMDVGGRSRVR